MGAAVFCLSAYTSLLSNLLYSILCEMEVGLSFVPVNFARFDGKPAGISLLLSLKPVQSMLLRSLLLKSLKVELVLYPKVAPTERKFLLGTSLVVTCINPPANSPVRSGVAVLLITILSTTLAGITSNENDFLSGSELGSCAPFRNAVL